jgi:hypothetical protein
MPTFTHKALAISATTWFAVVLAGQMTFATYLAVFYGGNAVQGNFAAWNKVITNGHVAGATANNVTVSLHVLFAFLITLSGALQLLPWLRRRFPRVHRWNGRLYLLSAVVMSLGGLAMLWVRTKPGTAVRDIGISIDAVLIMWFAAMALRHAIARRFDLHRRWALRLFLAVSAVWFFRVMLMFWIVLWGRPVGFDGTTFQGPFLDFLSFAQYLLPLALLELYFRAQQATRPAQRIAMAGGLGVLTLATGAGIAVAAMALWLPLM